MDCRVKPGNDGVSGKVNQADPIGHQSGPAGRQRGLAPQPKVVPVGRGIPQRVGRAEIFPVELAQRFFPWLARRNALLGVEPAIAVRPDRTVLAFGSPGSEVLGQAMLQAFLNMTVFGMDPQSAVETPRFASYSWPASAIPHA